MSDDGIIPALDDDVEVLVDSVELVIRSAFPVPYDQARRCARAAIAAVRNHDAARTQPQP